MENIENYKNILKKIKDVEDLKEINHFLVKEIKLRNNIEALLNKEAFTQGQIVTTKGLRPQHVNNKRVTIVSIKSTRAVVLFEGETRKTSVPLNCLEAIE